MQIEWSVTYLFDKYIGEAMYILLAATGYPVPELLVDFRQVSGGEEVIS